MKNNDTRESHTLNTVASKSIADKNAAAGYRDSVNQSKEALKPSDKGQQNQHQNVFSSELYAEGSGKHNIKPNAKKEGQDEVETGLELEIEFMEPDMLGVKEPTLEKTKTAMFGQNVTERNHQNGKEKLTDFSKSIP